MKKKYIFPIICSICIILASILLPGIILQAHFDSQIDVVYEVSPEDYALTDAYYKNASAQLSDYEKMLLISGIWGSECELVDHKNNPDASSITDIKAATLARDAVLKLYNADLYPYQFSILHDKYYFWKAKLYKATDTTFQTYVVYYWLITFQEVNTGEIHDILITEDGTLLSIRNNCGLETTASYNDRLKQHYTRFNFFYCEETEDIPMYKETAIDNPTFTNRFYALFGYERVQTESDLKLYLNNYNSQKTGDLYYLYVAKSKTHANYTLIPYQ